MSNRSGTAGKSTRQMAKRRRNVAIWMAVITLGIVIVLGLVVMNQRALGLGGGAVLVLLIIMRILPDLIDQPLARQKKAEKRAIRGAIAEERIADLLAELDTQAFFVLHDIPTPYGNIDHIVIGKERGVFLLETKAHGGKVETSEGQLLVNSKPPEKDFIAQALKNAYWLRGEIEKETGCKIWITPVLVFTNAFVPPSKPIKGVNIVNKKYLPNLLQRQVRPGSNLAAVWEAKERLSNHLSGN